MPSQTTSFISYQRRALANSLIVFGLMFIWSITGTIALRNVLLVLLLGSAPFVSIDQQTLKRCATHPTVLLLLALTGWIVFQNQFLAWDSSLAWNESGQWFKSMICLGLGLALGCAPRHLPAHLRWQRWAQPITAAWALHLLLNVALKDWGAQSFSGALQAGTAIGTRDMVSYLGTGLLALLLAEGVARAGGGERGFPLPTKGLWTCVFAAIVLTTATMTRNSILVMALELAITTAALIGTSGNKQQRSRRRVLAATAMLLVTAAALANLTLDNRWKNFSDSARIAWDIDQHTWWIDQVKNPQPANSQGVPVDHSAYNRIAWMRGASYLITEYPLGIGYDRNAFRRALMRHYGAASTASGHAHAGLLDFTLATGLPGGLLLTAALLTAINHGWRRWRATHGVAGLALAIFVAGYFLRAAIDGTVRDHMLEQAMFVFGVLLATSLADLGQEKDDA